MSSDNHDTVDVAVFSELRATTGAEFVADLVGTFCEEAAALLVELRIASASGDAVRCKRIAHSLKSNANTFGATRLANMARTIEGAGLGASPIAEIDGLASEFTRVAEQLKGLSNARS
jgi:histidine phosphotransfer protein HptB